MRPHKLDNITMALKMVEDAKVKTNFLKSTHLIDKDLKMILGMIWAIILDYQIKGISVEELTAKVNSFLKIKILIFTIRKVYCYGVKKKLLVIVMLKLKTLLPVGKVD